MPPPDCINLDANATTPLLPEVIEEIVRVSREAPGNPGSRHALGRRARQELEGARERIAQLLQAQPAEVIFTSGGTEAINLALRGLATHPERAVAAPAGEHPATEATLAELAAHGVRRVALPLTPDGQLDAVKLDHLPWDDIQLATVLLAHNETGVVQQVGPLRERCRQHGVPLHLDAVQAVGKIDVEFHALGATALSLAAHKFHGPRGIGALLLRAGTPLTPLLRGGHQERGRRPGTECVALAAGMARALELWHRDRLEITQRLTGLRDRLWRGLESAAAPVQLIGDRARRLPNTLNVAFPGCDGDALLVSLDLVGVGCSLGSTCASGSTEVSPILEAMRVPAEWQRACVRFSLHREQTVAEIDAAIERIASVVAQLRRR